MDIVEFIDGTLRDYRGRMDVALDGLSTEEMAWQPNAECNSIAFTLWHMARIEDRWIQYFAQNREDVWVKSGWYVKFGLDEVGTGWNSTLEQVANFPVISAEDLLGYYQEVRNETESFIRGLGPADLDVVPGRVILPPNTPRGSNEWPVGRLFRQIFGELNQHLGQIGYLRGMIRGFNAMDFSRTPLQH